MSDLSALAARFSRLALLLLFAAALPLAACSDKGDQGASEETAAAGMEETAPAAPAHEQISWDLSDIFATQDDWNAARLALLDRIPELQSYQGRLGEGPDVLLAFLRLQTEITTEAYKVLVYAGMLSDEDQRIGEHQEMRQSAQEMASRLTQAASWATPEILELGAERVMEYIAADPEGYDPYRFPLQNTLRNAPHTLSSEGERIMALAALPTGQAFQTYSLLANSDIEWPTITLSDGTEAHLDPTGYTHYRAVQNRADRQAVFDAFWGKWAEFQSTAGQILNSHIQGRVFEARVRHFDSALQMDLDEDNLPTAVYDTLIQQVNAALPLYWRYLRLRARLLHVDDLGYQDTYPTAIELDRDFGIEETRDMVLHAVEPLGQDYVDRLTNGTAQDWEHVYPQPGKRSGAYMNGGAYRVHPYVLLNHTDDWESVETYAHEWGHAMHTLYSQESQPFDTAFYSTFIAETASILNQILLEDYAIDHAANDQERLFYIDRVLEQYRGTLFRQTMFAEFEQEAYNEVEQGNPITGERLSQMYLELVRRYHGQDEGVMNVDDEIGMEWAYIPHFYFNHYVFQYATSQVISDYFAGRIRDGDPDAVDQVLQVLRAGGSDYPYNIILNAGLDMASADAYQPALSRLERMLDEYEELLDKLGY